ncbi:transposase [Rhodococcus tukisamuensis]|uniref:Putative transposase of IS4/5 family n=1 Tax=Rhodococcus tukisamuensis TaxID=168276 RepID=A0A1G6UL59_9NOCA|nr:transposase [Rhodococcus tukisamuensis]SDD41317.1 Putative transposase of IS4/5 family [Rhodococcus tukisamuensis]
MSRTEYLSDAQWALIEPLLPSVGEQGGRPFRNKKAELVGASPFRGSPVPLWASDHTGVVAELKLK